MKKDIKDYLHLYKGQLGRFFKPTKQEWTQWQTVHGEFIHTVDVQDWQVQLLLRPLSDMTEDENSKYWVGAAEYFRELLSKGFDLFGLIEAGLAIDKTTLKQEA